MWEPQKLIFDVRELEATIRPESSLAAALASSSADSLCVSPEWALTFCISTDRFFPYMQPSMAFQTSHRVVHGLCVIELVAMAVTFDTQACESVCMVTCAWTRTMSKTAKIATASGSVDDAFPSTVPEMWAEMSGNTAAHDMGLYKVLLLREPSVHALIIVPFWDSSVS